MTKKKIKYAIVLFALLFFCLSIPRIFAIFKETKSNELNITIKHPSYTVTFNPNQGVVNPTSIVVVYGHMMRCQRLVEQVLSLMDGMML